jgi:hypothetical protein
MVCEAPAQSICTPLERRTGCVPQQVTLAGIEFLRTTTGDAVPAALTSGAAAARRARAEANRSAACYGEADELVGRQRKGA